MDFLQNNSIYVVLLITLVIWLGLGFFMFSIDNKVSRLEKIIINQKDTNSET
jgi:CcmD family protein